VAWRSIAALSQAHACAAKTAVDVLPVNGHTWAMLQEAETKGHD
jgi:hypothetical protein